ncbi:hypothetical protein JXQ31_07540 [candidate division KSB1 bacterium]|nr:hypothetical protein [candidate division KSB1 bacterium]
MRPDPGATPGSGLAVGTYEVRVRTVSTSPFIFGDSGNFFIAIKTPSVSDLGILTPVSGATFVHGDSMDIQWEGTGLSGTLNIFLEKTDGASNIIIKSNHPAASSKSVYIIPAGVQPGTYRVKIVWGSITAVSGNFIISSSQQSKSMEIILPKSGQVFTMGNPLTVEWITSGLLGTTLKVYLCKGVNGVQHVSTIANDWPNTPHLQKSWKIPLNLVAGNYKIVVLDITGIVYHGNVFTVKPPGTVQIGQANKNNNINRLAINNETRITQGKKPYILSFYPDKLAKRIPSILGAGDSFIVKLNFYWKDDDGDLLNGKWHFSYKSDKFLYSGNQSGRIGEENPARYTGTKGSVFGFKVTNVKGKVNDQVRIWFVLEDSQGNFSDKMTGLVTLSQ